jgi:hypothetical protein
MEQKVVQKIEITAVGNRSEDYATPLYLQKLAVTSSTSSGLSVGIVRSRTKATELLVAYNQYHIKEDTVFCIIIMHCSGNDDKSSALDTGLTQFT